MASNAGKPACGAPSFYLQERRAAAPHHLGAAAFAVQRYVGPDDAQRRIDFMLAHF
jgi:hypothetical protein